MCAHLVGSCVFAIAESVPWASSIATRRFLMACVVGHHHEEAFDVLYNSGIARIWLLIFGQGNQRDDKSLDVLDIDQRHDPPGAPGPRRLML